MRLSNFWGGERRFRVYRDSYSNFTLLLLFDLLFTGRRNVISRKVFNSISLYYIDSLFKRKVVWKLIQMRNKISRISYFCFSFKLNEKKRVLLKKYGLEIGLQKIVRWRGVLTLKDIMNKDLRRYTLTFVLHTSKLSELEK